MSNFKMKLNGIQANPYLAEKLNQGRKDMESGKGTHMPLDDLWK
ncbi:MAG TPA: hypothetical protein VHE59_02630 [Mucilaginibacter sp.]|nr:hypothetical protein [Mucilaginibacter sp.]